MSVDVEIREQPAVARRQLAEGWDAVRTAVASFPAGGIRHVVIAARGTSDHAAIYAQYVLGARNRLPVTLAAPSIISMYGVAPRFDGALVVGISQSGESPDVVAVVEAGKEQGCPTLAITNAPGSPLASVADHVLDLRAGPELAVAATKTYTSELVAVAMLSAALDDAPSAARAELEQVPAAIERALEQAGVAGSVAAELAAMRQAIVVGRGFEYATAREWALKLKEVALVFAEPYSPADLAHGPVAVLGPGAMVLAVAPSGVTAGQMHGILAGLRDNVGTDLLVMSDLPALRALGRWSIALPSGLPEWLAPIAAIVPAQLFTVALARAKGLDPERPPHIRKVTLTS
ncbi:MAG TPA: SIS domain-containing protein [Candidatus Limnocylindrales bacterium]|nr:SIS domain-containing protein [Candidatus Limnocylindrales bacterium]